MRYLILLVVVFLSACGLTPEMYGSQKADWYSGSIDSVTIVYVAKKLGADAQKISQADFQRITSSFKEAGIDATAYFYSGMDLDAEEKIASIRESSDYMLIVDPTARTTGDTQNVTYLLSLFTKESEKKIWVATLFVPWGWTEGVFQRFDEMSALMVEQLRQDGLVLQRIAAAS